MKLYNTISDVMGH